MGVRLTDAGARFLDNVLPAIIQIEAAIQHAGSAGRVEDGVVRVGILTTLAGGFLRDLVEAWRGAFDGVGLQIRDGGRREHLRAIRARDLDIVFLTGNGRIEDCDQIELWQERVHVALPEVHPLAQEGRLDWQQLKGEHFIVPSQEPGLCCTNPVWDSSHESSVVAGIHEQTYTANLQDQKLASLQ